jgi:hypothetical protein
MTDSLGGFFALAVVPDITKWSHLQVQDACSLITIGSGRLKTRLFSVSVR